MNLPLTPLWQGICLAGCVVATALMWRRGRELTKEVFSGARGVTCLLLGAAGAGWAVASLQFGALPRLGLAMVVGAVALHAIERRKNARAAAVGENRSQRPELVR